MDIKPAYEHSKAGMIMFNISAAVTKFLVKHRWLYYVLACTWGFISTLLGLLISGVLGIAKIFTKNIKFEKFHWIYDIKVGPDYWGGFEMGLMFCRDQKSTDDYINDHEFGHSISQITWMGIFFLPVAGIPSCIRYWYQEFRSRKGKENKPYDAIWFEDAATQCGKYAVWYITHKEK